MSYYDDSSLFVAPNGYKTSVLFAQKPMDANGQLAFTRSNSTATRVGPDGLIEKVRTNLVLHSQNFSNAAWSKSAGTTLTHSQTDPDGGTTATRVVMTSGTNNFFTQAISGSGTRFITLSVFVKGVTTGGSFSLNTGTAASRTGTTITYTTTWTRYQIIQNETTSNTGFQIDNFSNSLGQVAGDFLIAFAQVESSDFGATPYIATTTAAVSVGMLANVPRLDYLNSTCPKLILEPQRTNLSLFSESFDNAYWTKLNCSIAANDLISPDGTQNADKLTTTSTIAEVYARATFATILAGIGNTYTTSIYAKKGTANFLRVRNLFVENGTGFGNAWFNLNTGTVGTVQSSQTATMISVGNGWYRCTLTGVVGTTLNAGFVDFGFSNAETSIPTTSVNGYLWAASLELGAYATSYIPTLGAAVTRSADAASKTGISALIGQTEGTLFVEVDYSTLSGLNMFLSIRPNASNKVEIYRDSGNIFGEITGSVNFAFSAAKPVGTHKIAFAYKSGSSALFIDGVLVNQNTTAFTFSATLADLFINQRSGGTFIEAANYKQALLFKTRLTNAQLAELTAI